jgi:SET domain-containing protein
MLKSETQFKRKFNKYPKYKIKKTKTGTGFGYFADENIEKGIRLVQYVGEKVTNKWADENPNEYIFWIDKKYSLNGEPSWNVARYVNYSHDPNAESVDEDGKIYFETIKDVKKGEEITIDYGKWHFNEFIKPHGCKCDVCLLKK